MKQHHAFVWFAVVVILAIGIFWYLWNTQVSFGRSVDGTRGLGELMLRRDALNAQRPSSELMMIKATRGCCNYLEHAQRGSQLKIDVVPGNGNCYEDALTQSRVKVGFVIVDVEPLPCEKNIVV